MVQAVLRLHLGDEHGALVGGQVLGPFHGRQLQELAGLVLGPQSLDFGRLGGEGLGLPAGIVGQGALGRIQQALGLGANAIAEAQNNQKA